MWEGAEEDGSGGRSRKLTREPWRGLLSLLESEPDHV